MQKTWNKIFGCSLNYEVFEGTINWNHGNRADRITWNTKQYVIWNICGKVLNGSMKWQNWENMWMSSMKLNFLRMSAIRIHIPSETVFYWRMSRFEWDFAILRCQVSKILRLTWQIPKKCEHGSFAFPLD